MNDLFMSNLNIQEKIDLLKLNIRKYYVDKKIITNRSNIKLFYGNLDNINNNILVISDSPVNNLFNNSSDKQLYNFLVEQNIIKIFHTYNFLLSGIKSSKEDIKQFGIWIQQLTDIINPKLIVCIGENSQLCFFKRKFLLENFHGKLVGDYNSIPIYITYPIVDYIFTGLEDRSYKEYLIKNDWSPITTKYNEVIK